MKKLTALLLAAVTALSCATVSLAATRYFISDNAFVSLDYDALDNVDHFQPGVTYRIPLMDGSYAFGPESSEVFKVQVKITDGKEFVTKLSIEKIDGYYYLVFTPKKSSKNYGTTQDVEFDFITTERGTKSSDFKVTSDTEADRYNNATDGNIEGGHTIVIGDVVYTKFVSHEVLTIGYPDEVYIEEGEYEVDNNNPIAVAADIARSTLKFGNAAEYDARFGQTDKRFNLGYSTAVNTAVEKSNPNASTSYIKFNGTPYFAANANLRVYDRDAKYMYEIDGDKLIELDADQGNGYMQYRTDHLTAYVVSDIPLNGKISSSSSSSSPSSSSSKPSSSASSYNPVTPGTKPNPDTGR